MNILHRETGQVIRSIESADLSGADLSGARINWQSHPLIAEILLREARDDVQRRMVAGLVLISTDWCWTQFLAVNNDQREWALRTLAGYITEDDDAPRVLHKYRTDNVVSSDSDAVVEVT